MAKQSVVSKEAKEYIIEQIRENGLITVEEVAGIVEKHYCFDPIRSKQRELDNYSRRLLATIRDSAGTRTVLAVKGSPGLYVNIESCSDIPTLKRVDSQLADRFEGLKLPRRIIKRRIQHLAGQQSLFQAEDHLPDVITGGR